MSREKSVFCMTNGKNIFRLRELVSDKTKALTLKVDLDTLAEYHAAAEILRARNVSSMLHHHVVSRINEAKAATSPQEFAKLVETQKKRILERSEMKAKERRKVGVPYGGEITTVMPKQQKRKTK